MSSDTLKIFLELSEVEKVMKNQLFFKFLGLKISFVISIKSQKVPRGHVCAHKNCLKLRVITPITSPCTYGPKYVPDILFRDL